MSTGSSADAMYRDSVMNELRQIELAVINGERQLAEQEALLVSLKNENRYMVKAQAELEMMRENQLRYEQDRQRLLSMLQP
jgi:hypothetical protein